MLYVNPKVLEQADAMDKQLKRGTKLKPLQHSGGAEGNGKTKWGPPCIRLDVFSRTLLLGD